MSSGRDEMMSNWSRQEKMEKIVDPYQKRMLTRMIEYRQTLITEISRLDKLIKELQDASQEV